MIIDKGIPGGQMVLTDEIASYPGIEKTPGYELSNAIRKQAESFGSNILSNNSIELKKPDGEIKEVAVNNQTFTL